MRQIRPQFIFIPKDCVLKDAALEHEVFGT
jgi:hypothetical protein